MNLRLLRLGCDIPVTAETVSTIQIEDRVLFARVVRSLLSEAGEHGLEPYCLIDDAGRRIAPKRALRVVNSLPEAPTNDRALMTKLFQRMIERSELNHDTYTRIHDLSGLLIAAIEEVAEGLTNRYTLASEGGLEAYLKALSFAPEAGADYTTLENCMSYMRLCSDVDPNTPVILVNAKSYFSNFELQKLIDEAVSLKISLLLLESWHDNRVFLHEKKTVIDQQLCFQTITERQLR